MGIFYRDSKSYGPFRINTSSGGVGGSVKIGPARITQRADGRKTIRIATGIAGLKFEKTIGKRKKR